MRIPFRQGIVTVPENFLELNGTTVNLVIPTPDLAMVTLADGEANYLHTERLSIPSAWTGPFFPGSHYWLYWDIDVRTGERTFGHTLVEPLQSFTPPATPTNDQHWFDLSSNKMKVWNMVAGVWQHKIRVFAAKLESGTNFVSVGIDSPAYPGTQVGALENVPAAAGALIFDVNGDPIKRRNSFFTTEDVAVSGVASASGVKVGAILIDAVATANIPAYSIVHFTGFHQITHTTNGMMGEGVYGMIEVDAVTGDVVNVVLEGIITNPLWDWSAVGVNSPLYVSDDGYLTPVKPANAVVVASVVDKNTVIVRPSLQVVTYTGGLPDDYVYRSGDTMTGLLILSGNPVVAMGAATKQYVDTRTLNDLADVNTAGVTIGDVLTYDGTNWIAAEPTGGGGGTGESLWEVAQHAYRPTAIRATASNNLSSCINASGRFETTAELLAATLSLSPDTYQIAVNVDGVTRSTSGTEATFVTVSDVINHINSQLSAYVSAAAVVNATFSGVVLTAVSDSIQNISFVDSTTDPLISAATGPSADICDYTLSATGMLPAIISRALTPKAQVPANEEVFIPLHTYVESNPVTAANINYWTARTPPVSNSTSFIHSGLAVGRPNPSSNLPYVTDQDVVYTTGIATTTTGHVGYIDVRYTKGPNGGQTITNDLYQPRRFYGRSDVGGYANVRALGVTVDASSVYLLNTLDEGTLSERTAVLESVNASLSDGAPAWSLRFVSTIDGATTYGIASGAEGDITLSSNGANYLAFTTTDGTNNGVQVARVDAGSVLWKSHSMLGTCDYVKTAVHKTTDTLYLALGGGSQASRVVKFDSAGTVLWEREIGEDVSGIQSAVITDVAVNQSTNTVYVAGYCSDFRYLAGARGMFVMAIDGTTAAHVWTRLIQYQTFDADNYGVNIACDASSVFFTGPASRGSPISQLDLLVGSLNATTGAVNWTREFGRRVDTGPGYDLMSSSAQLLNGKVEVTDECLLLSFTTWVGTGVSDSIVVSKGNFVTAALSKTTPTLGANGDSYEVVAASQQTFNSTATPAPLTATVVFDTNVVTSLDTASATSTFFPLSPNATLLAGVDVVAPQAGISIASVVPSLEVANITKTGQLILGELLPAPMSLVGSPTDKKGMVRADNNAVWYCVADYDGATDIWKRAPFVSVGTPRLKQGAPNFPNGEASDLPGDVRALYNEVSDTVTLFYCVAPFNGVSEIWKAITSPLSNTHIQKRVDYQTVDNAVSEYTETLEYIRNARVITAAPFTTTDADLATVLMVNSASNNTLTLNHNTDGWWTTIKNVGTGILTVQPASGTIDGNSQVILGPRQDVTVFAKSGHFWTVGQANRSPDGWATLTEAATMTPDMMVAKKFKVFMTGNRTLAAPVNAADGDMLYIRFTQDATGNRTISFPSAFKWAGGTVPTLTTTGSRVDILRAVYERSLGVWVAELLKDVR